MSIDNADNQIEANLADEAEELLIQFDGDEESHTSDEDSTNESSVIKDLRKQLRLQAQQLNSIKPNQQEEQIILGDKPTLESCEYDTDKFEAEYDAYVDRKAKIAKQEEAKQSKLTKAEQANADQLKLYEQQAKALNARDFEAKQQSFLDVFSNTVQGQTIMKAAKNKALVVYALGSNQAMLDKLEAITDEVELAAEVARIESRIKVQNRQTNITPDKTVKSNAVATNASTSSLQKQLDKIRANSNGNMTEVVKFKKLHKEHNLK